MGFIENVNYLAEHLGELNEAVSIIKDNTDNIDVINSITQQQINTITPFLDLDLSDSNQQVKVIDIISKAIYYTDVGTVNAVELTRGATSDVIETLFDGMVVLFTPANENTGATTLRIKTLEAKPLKYNGEDLPAGYLNTTSKYIAIYDKANGCFNVDVITGGSAKQPFKVANAVNADEAINKGQLLTEIKSVDGSGSGLDADKLDGYHLLATVNPDGSFNNDGIFKIKEVDGEKVLVGILDVNINISSTDITTSIFDIFGDGKNVALLEFENNAYDTGGMYNGTWYGTPNYENGKIGMAASFDGSSLVQLSTDVYEAAAINYPTAISAWIYLKAGEIDALIYDTGGPNSGLGFGVRNNKIYTSVRNNNNSDVLYGNTQLENETWYFLTMVFDGNTKTMKLYINGNLDISKIMSVYPAARDGTSVIGGTNGNSVFYDDTNAHYTRCLIDHIRFFRYKLLTDEEIQTLYNEGA